MQHRDIGIGAMPEAPWGTHLCLFYETAKDLGEVVVPYVKAGLHNNELCMWVTSEALEAQRAKSLLRKAVTNLDAYTESGHIQIIDQSEWYTKSGKFEPDHVLQGWLDKETEALTKGFEGLRVTGDTSWLTERDWQSFIDYEAAVDSIMGEHRILVLCTYSLDRCGIPDIVDVAANHQIACIREGGEWRCIQSSEHKRNAELLRRTDAEWAARGRILSSTLSTRDPGELLCAIADQVLALLSVDFVAIYLVEDEQLMLRCWRGGLGELRAHMHSFPASALPRGTQVPGLVRESASERGIIPDFAKRHGIVSWAYMPLLLALPQEGEQGRWLGAVVVGSRSRERLGQEDWRAFRGMARQLTLAIDYSRVYRQATERQARLKALRSVDLSIIRRRDLGDLLEALLGEVSKELEGKALAISLLSEDQLRTKISALRLPDGSVIREEAFTLSESLLHWLVQCKQPVIIYNLLEDPRVQMHRDCIRNAGLVSYLAAPLVCDGQATGILHVLTTEPTKFPKEEVDFLVTMAGQAAIAIENAQLLDRVRADADELQRHIQERDQMEQALTRAQRDKATILDSMSELLVYQDAEGRILWANRAAAESVNSSPEQLVGRHCYEVWHGRQERCPECLVAAAIRAGRPREGEMTAADGSIWHVRGDPVRDEDGNITSAIKAALDITERKRAQEGLQRQQEALHRAARLESIGKLAGGIAHEFNNLMTGILGYGNLLLGTLDADDPRREDIEEMRAAALRAASLTQQLLAFSRRQTLEPRLLSLNAAVTSISRMLEHVIGENIERVTLLDPDLGLIRADPDRIQQVIMNLVVNARDAMPGGGTLTIQTSNVNLAETYVETTPPMPAGAYVLLTVTDTGCGMDEETRKHLFEPFFTTKAPGEGTGLGLSTAYGIVKQHEGYIWGDSEPGRGSRFRIYLPRAAGEAEVAQARPPAAQPPPGSEAVLVVEDEEAVRRLVHRVLSANGYTVFAVGSTEEARNVIAAHGNEISLVLTDVILPDGTGPELCRQLEQKHPSLRVLYMSGYAADGIARRSVLEPGAPFLAKPFGPEDLLGKVREMLSAPPK